MYLNSENWSQWKWWRKSLVSRENFLLVLMCASGNQTWMEIFLQNQLGILFEFTNRSICEKNDSGTNTSQRKFPLPVGGLKNMLSLSIILSRIWAYLVSKCHCCVYPQQESIDHILCNGKLATMVWNYFGGSLGVRLPTCCSLLVLLNIWWNLSSSSSKNRMLPWNPSYHYHVGSMESSLWV